MKPIIEVESIAKRYTIGTGEAPYQTLREALADMVKAPFTRRERRRAQVTEDEIWALRDVNFEVHPGEVVGIIGHNGAGKSTLLKILSRITEPSAGQIRLYGRVVSLLEVGTGFHPELTGRENIYLNGAILGMRRSEIDRKFDEIVAFSEIEKFLHTPVKHYSSGMYTRLAFAVAAHLEPEILIIDEVLAVGDARFQRKCMDKMQDVGQQGRTVLFVSHNLPAIVRLCPRAILLKGGRIEQDGASHEVARLYMDTAVALTAERVWTDPQTAPGDEWVRLRAVRLKTADGQPADLVDIRKTVTIEIEYDVLQAGRRLSGGIICNNEEGVCLFSSADLSPDSIYNQDLTFTGRRITTCTIPGNLLAEGMFSFSVAIYAVLDGIHVHAQTPDIVGFRVFDPVEGDSARGIYVGPVAGLMRPRLAWEARPLAAHGRSSASRAEV